MKVCVKEIRMIYNFDNKQDYFTKASAALHRATQNRSYFKDITILIPEKWSVNNDARPSSGESYGKANVVVTPGNQSQNSVYTEQKRGCAVPGEYINLPEWFLLDNDEAVSTYGPIGMLVF